MKHAINPFGDEYETDEPKESDIPVAEESSDGEREKDTAVTKCPACGANMVFSPQEGCLYCEHCGTKQEVEEKYSEEMDFAKLLDGNTGWAAETHVYCCNNCGAKQVLDKRDIATTCSFCGTTNIVETDELAGIKPNAVVPFRLSTDEATDVVKKWVKKKPFAPRKFKKNVSPEDVSGVYNPAFTFDTQTNSTYSGRLGEYYYTTHRDSKGNVRRTRHVRYFNVSGTFDKFYDDILIQASTVIEQKKLNKLQPFDTNNSNEYAQEYLSGFTASQYTKDGLACWGEARKLIEKNIRASILAQYHYDEISYFNINTACNDITYKYILLPVYVGHCNWRTKLYNFFVNGYNGKITGKTPASPFKVSLLTLICMGAAVGLYFLGKLLLGG